MAALESEPEQAPLRQPAPRRGLLPALLSVSVLTAGLAVGAMAFTSVVDPPLSPAQQQLRTATFTGHGALILPALAASELNRALAGMQLPAPDRATLEQDLAQQRLELAWLTLWDDQAEDGDVVQVESHGFIQQVTLRHTPTPVAIPRVAGEPVLIRGIYDGGGGITVAAASRGQAVPLPVMAPGQVIGLPVAP